MTQISPASVESAAIKPRCSWGPELAIIAAGCVLLFTGLGTRGLWYLEGRWAEITREMFLTGDFFHPTIGGEPYFDKPVLTYWLVAAVSVLTHRLDEWAIRVPSAISGLIAVAATMWLGRMLWSARVGRVAGAILLTSGGFVFWARTANADLENLAAIMLAIAWYWARHDRPNFGTFMVFYLIAFVGALMKGLPSVVIPVLALLPDIVVHKRWRAVLNRTHAAAALIGAILFLLFSWYAGGLKIMFRENVIRFFNSFDHEGPVYLYAYSLPAFLMPWAPLFVAALVGLLLTWKALDARTRWLLYAGGIIIGFFTLSSSRRNYYVLPLVPLASLMIAVFAVELTDWRLRNIRRWGMIAQLILLAGAAGLELAGSAAGAMIEGRLGFALPNELYASLLVVGLAAVAIGLAVPRMGHWIRLSEGRWLWSAAGMAAVLVGGLFCWQQGIVESYRSERPFALNLKRRVEGLPSERVVFYRAYSPDLLFYAGLRVPPTVLTSDADLNRFAARNEERVLVAQRQYMADAARVWPQRLTDRPDLVQKRPPWLAQAPDKYWVAWRVSPGSDVRGSAWKN